VTIWAVSFWRRDVKREPSVKPGPLLLLAGALVLCGSHTGQKQSVILPAVLAMVGLVGVMIVEDRRR
jgi:hypothetical protein